MRRRRKEKTIHHYDCTITGKSFKLTEKAAHPEELISIEAYYQMNQDKDDRPAVVKKRLGLDENGVAPVVAVESSENN